MLAIPSDAPVVCPHCDYTMGDEGGGAADFHIPHKLGEASAAETECDSCYETFEVTRISETECTVEAV